MSAPLVTLPPHLRAGDRVAVLAPSSPFAQDAFDAGLAVLRGWGLDPIPVVQPAAAPLVYLAGSDRARSGALEGSLSNPDVRAVYCARGGYGIARILDGIDWQPLRADPRPLIGFSDVTALHVAALAAANVGGVHAPLLTTLASAVSGDSAGATATRRLLLEGEAPVLQADVRAPARRGQGGWSIVEGPLLVANLATLTSLVGTPDLPSLAGWLLLLEDWHERAYRIDRMLTQLRRAGALSGVVGVAIGDFEGDHLPDGSGPSAADVFLDRLEPLGIPVAAGFPVGHLARNWPAIIGASYQLDLDARTLRPMHRLPAPPAR